MQYFIWIIMGAALGVLLIFGFFSLFHRYQGKEYQKRIHFLCQKLRERKWE